MFPTFFGHAAYKHFYNRDDPLELYPAIFFLVKVVTFVPADMFRIN